MRSSTVTLVAPLVLLPSITQPCPAGRLLLTPQARALVLTVLHFSLVIFPSLSLHVCSKEKRKRCFEYLCEARDYSFKQRVQVRSYWEGDAYKKTGEGEGFCPVLFRERHVP